LWRAGAGACLTGRASGVWARGGLFKLSASLEGGVRRVVAWLRDAVEALLGDVEKTRGGLYTLRKDKLERLLGVRVSSELWNAVRRLATPCLYMKTSKGLVVRRECLKAILTQLRDNE